MKASDHTSVERLPLAEIALNAAIELDRSESGEVASIWMKRLAESIENVPIADFGLVPVYNRALTSANGEGPKTKADLYAKLRELSSRLTGEDNIIQADRIMLRDFCLALHYGLLNEGFQNHYNVVDTSRMH